MGNCIEKNRQVVIRCGNVAVQSNINQRQKKDGSEFDNGAMNANNNNNINMGNFNQAQSLGNMKSANSKMDADHRQSVIPPPPPVTGFMEHINQISHPLPPPHLSAQIQEQECCKNSNLLLPTPSTDASLEFDNNACYRKEPILEPCNRLPSPRTESEILSSPNLKSFCLDELKKATKNFSEDSLIGEGGFGGVYKGWLDENTLMAAKPRTGTAVAIKKLIPYGFQGHKEWLSEVNYLGRLRHPNLVLLIGYCLDGDDRILVYEFMPAGSLENHLFYKKSQPLSWTTRVKVAIDAARGLCFLHNSNSPVIYRDFKASNVLLDSDFNAKLADFGLAKTGPTGPESHVSTRVMGTEGYCDPHYRATGKLTIKCDVYSFGVVLLELLTGRRVIDETRCQEEKNLVHWVKLHVKDNGKVFRIMDSKLGGQYSKKSAYVAANIALSCVHHEPKYRPPMTYILEILENLPSQKHNNSK